MKTTTISLTIALLVLSACGQQSGYPNPEALIENPLTGEMIADQMLDFVAMLQIRAEESGEPITEGYMLRALDKALVEGKTLQKAAYAGQDAGKRGGFYGIDNNFARGSALLTKDSIYVGYNFEVSAAPGMRLYLAQHVAPHTTEELFSEPTVDIGMLKSIYGAQKYILSELSDEEFRLYRTGALYSEPLKMVIGLVQFR